MRNSTLVQAVSTYNSVECCGRTIVVAVPGLAHVTCPVCSVTWDTYGYDDAGINDDPRLLEPVRTSPERDARTYAAIIRLAADTFGKSAAAADQILQRAKEFRKGAVSTWTADRFYDALDHLDSQRDS